MVFSFYGYEVLHHRKIRPSDCIYLLRCVVDLFVCLIKHSMVTTFSVLWDLNDERERGDDGAYDGELLDELLDDLALDDIIAGTYINFIQPCTHFVCFFLFFVFC
jgi:hypothetical protein